MRQALRRVAEGSRGGSVTRLADVDADGQAIKGAVSHAKTHVEWDGEPWRAPSRRL